ncbi:MAG: hypothetical protein QXJ62_05905 [Nitrososphaeria archaeon]
MATKATVIKGKTGYNECWYHHNDGYLIGLSIELISLLREMLTAPEFVTREKIVKKLELEKLEVRIYRPEEAFVEIQADLEYIYEIIENPLSLTIYRTSNPYFDKDFVFPVWFCYAQYFPAHTSEIYSDMEIVEKTTYIFINPLTAYLKSLNNQQ